MTKSFLLPFIALSLFLYFGNTVQSQNIVVNGDLESWSGNTPTGWNIAQSISQGTTIVHSGNFSAKHTSTTTSQKLSQDLTDISEGQEYTISYWYFDNDPAARTRIYSYWLSGGFTLDANAAELRPTVYSTDNPGWQNFNVVLIAPAGADGFRFEVRVYQQDGNNGGAVYYDDFEFNGDMTIYPEPTNYPTNFSASAAALGINLTWTDAVGAQLPSGYIIMAGINSSLPVPADGTPVPNDNDLSDGNGALNVAYGIQQATFGGLESNTTYYFTIYSYTNSSSNIDYKTNGTAPSANATTSSIVIIETENFDLSWGNWTPVSVVGDQVWDRNNTYGINNTPCARMSGYSGSALDNDDWLISPALNLDDYTNEILEFYTAKNYTGPDLVCKISTDYNGGGNPYSATWTTLAFTPSPGTWQWTSSGLIDLSGYGGTAYIAFQYTSTTASAATWEVEDITIIGEDGGTVDPEPSNYPTAFTAIASGSAINLTWTDATGAQLPDKYILFAGISSSLPVPVDGTPVPNDPDLSDGSAVLNISYGVQTASFGNLLPATTYYFTIYPYTNSGIFIDYKTDGTAPSANATTSNTVTVTIESENFNESWGNWTTISVTGTQVWDRNNTYGIGNTPCAKMSGYEGQSYENEDWLISPPLNFNEYINEVLTFQNAKSYTGNDLELKVSTNYDGGGNPNSATWTNLTYIKSSGNFVWTNSGEIDLSGFNGTSVYVAFKYTSTASASATWEIDDISIVGEEEATILPEPSNYPTNFSADATGTSILLSWTDAVGTQLPDKYIIFAGTSSSLPLPVDGIPVADDLNLNDGSGAINIVYGMEEAVFAGLNPGITYYFVIYPYTNYGINTDYKTDGTAPTANAVTSLIPEPTNYPTLFSASATSSSVTLSWTDAAGGQLPEMYIIFAGTSASLPVPADGIPVPNDLNLTDGSGAINIAYGIGQTSFTGLTPNTTYHFSIYPYTNSGANINYKTDGTVPTAQATTVLPVLVTIEAENFNTSWGNWTTISVLGAQVWDRNNTYGVNFTPCARMSGYDGGYVQNDDWLISPPLNLSDYSNEIIVFQNAKNYTGNDIKLKVSVDYNGGGNPYSATWTELTFTKCPGNWVWTSSGDVDLSTYNGPAVYVAFHFTSTSTASATWEIDDIEIKGEENMTIDPEPTNYPTDFYAAALGTSIHLSWTDAVGTQLPDKYIIFAGINASLPVPVDGTPVANDLNLADGSAVLNINYGIQSASFSGLQPSTIYYFAIYPYTNSGNDINYKTDGTAPSAQVTTPNIAVVTIESENFDQGWGNWTTISVTGTQVWDRNNTFGVGNTPCAKMSGYSGQSYENEDWLISPALDLDNYLNAVITFQNAKNYTGNDLELKVSTNYSGSGNPNAGTWTNLTYTKSAGSFEWTSSGEVNLSGFNGPSVYVAFRYTSTTSASATWEIDNILITGEDDLGLDGPYGKDNLFTIFPNPSNGVINIAKPVEGFSKLSILSIAGERVEEFEIQDALNQIDLTDLTKGVYFMLITDEQTGETVAKKLILN
jgi:hypothetical protein